MYGSWYVNKNHASVQWTATLSQSAVNWYQHDSKRWLEWWSASRKCSSPKVIRVILQCFVSDHDDEAGLAFIKLNKEQNQIKWANNKFTRSFGEILRYGQNWTRPRDKAKQRFAVWAVCDNPVCFCGATPISLTDDDALFVSSQLFFSVCACFQRSVLWS